MRIRYINAAKKAREKGAAQPIFQVLSHKIEVLRIRCAIIRLNILGNNSRKADIAIDLKVRFKSGLKTVTAAAVAAACSYLQG